MKKWLTIILFTMLLALTGCQSSPPVPTPVAPSTPVAPPTVAPTPVSPPTPAPISSPIVAPTPDISNMADPDSLYTLNAGAGQEIRISLQINGSAGYIWELARPPDESVLKLAKFESVPPEVKAGQVGPSATYVWSFKAAGKGQTEVSFNYRRPWEKDIPLAKTATYKVIVAESSTATPSTGQSNEQVATSGKYLFLEEWTETYQSPMRIAIDFPDYKFEKDTGWLRPWLAPQGKLFPTVDLSQLKLVYGTGQSRTGSAGGGIASRVVAVTELPFTRENVIVEKFDADGTVYLTVDKEKVVLKAGESRQKKLKRTISGGDELSRHRITNYGLHDKSKIQLTSTNPTPVTPAQTSGLTTPPAALQRTVNSVVALRNGDFVPQHLKRQDAAKTSEDFDINMYFSVLPHLSMNPGYVLDYVYFFEVMQGFPVIYAREVSQTPYRTYSEFAAANGDITALEAWSKAMEQIRVDGMAEGFFEFAVLRMIGNQFYPWQSYVDSAIVDKTGLEKLLDSRKGLSRLSPDVEKKARSLELRPVVEFNDKTAIVKIVIFSEMRGFIQKSYTISRDFPHKVIKEESKTLVEYRTNVLP